MGGPLPGGRFHNSLAFQKIWVDVVSPVIFWSLLWLPGVAWSHLEHGNGVDVGVRNVPKWGFEIADSSYCLAFVWHGGGFGIPNLKIADHRRIRVR